MKAATSKATGLTADAIGEVIVGTVARAIAPLAERVSVLEAENRALRDRVVDLHARIAVHDDDHVPR